MIESPKRSAFNRVVEKYRLAQEENIKRARALKEKQKQIKKTFSTEGWKHIERTIENSIAELKNKLYDTSTWRVFRCMEIRSEIKALSRIYTAMKTEEVSILLRERKEKE